MTDVTREHALEELHRFFDAMDIYVEYRDPTDNEDEEEGEREFDEEEMDENAQLELIIRTLQTGRLTINEKGEPVYVPKLGDTTPIVFHEPTGASYMAADKRGKRRKKDGDEPQDSTAKMFRIMADMTRTNPQRFASMMNRDLKVCMAVAGVFLAG